MTTDPVALVTGAARGIGAATALELGRAGYQVVAVDACLGEKGQELAGVNYSLGSEADLCEVEHHGEGKIQSVVCDVRDGKALAAIVHNTLERFGRLDVAVAAAAIISGGKPMWQTPNEEFATLIDIDLIGVWNLAQACLPAMIANAEPQSCRFIAIASAAGNHGLLHLAGYSAVKHGVVGLIKGIAADLHGTGVSACAISPGSTRTAMLDASAQIYNLDSAQAFESSSLLNRIIEPAEIAQAVRFCCSDAGSALNGSVLDLSGGFRA
jgi:SDR family mycofactocin-dependent oxidoreductase